MGFRSWTSVKNCFYIQSKAQKCTASHWFACIHECYIICAHRTVQKQCLEAYRFWMDFAGFYETATALK